MDIRKAGSAMPAAWNSVVKTKIMPITGAVIMRQRSIQGAGDHDDVILHEDADDGRSKNTGGGCENERNEKLHEQIKMQKLFQAFAVVCTVAVAEERLRAEGEPDQNQHGDHVDF